jgi:hypothetical protein
VRVISYALKVSGSSTKTLRVGHVPPPGRGHQVEHLDLRGMAGRCSRNGENYDPCCSFGIASSTVPARVSRALAWYPFREFTGMH